MKKKSYKKNSLMSGMKDTMSLGIGSMTGLSAMGSVKALVPGGAGNGVFNAASTGMTLLNTGQLMKNTKNVLKAFK